MRHGNTLKTLRVNLFLTWHRWDGVPGIIGEVKDLPLNLSGAFLVYECVSTGSRRRQSSAISSGRPGSSGFSFVGCVRL
ncbi:hypothetical protein ACHQM5_004451 [Ranunculus cassubicifolius]